MKKTLLAAAAALTAAVALGATLVPGGTASAATTATSTNPGFTATFVSPYWFDGKDDAAQLKTQFAAQKQAGVNTVIIEWSAHEDAMTAAYPANPTLGYGAFNDAVPQYVAAAKAAGLTVWMGLIVAPDMYENQANITSASWLAGQATRFQKLADDLYGKYGSSIAGWYIPVEPGNNMLKTPAGAARIGGWLGSISSYLHTHDGKKPVMVSPSMPSAESAGLSPEQFVAEMQPMVAAAHIDVWNLQDGFEMTSWSPEQEANAFAAAQALVQKYNAKLWASVYTPAVDGNGTVPLSRLVPYLRAIAETGTTLSTWEFAQYLDPDASQANGAQMTTNFAQYRSYLAAAKPAPARTATATAQSSTSVLVRWTQATDAAAQVAGYEVWRRAGSGVWQFAGQTGRAGVYLDATAQPGTAYSYRVVSVSASGAAGTAASTASITTPNWPSGTVRPASYAIATSSSASDTRSYADHGTLTNGKLAASSGYWTTGWTGVNVAGAGTVTYTIDLGKTRSVSAFDSRWLYTPGAGITLPGSIGYATSTDGKAFTTRATVGSQSGKTIAGIDGQVVDYAATVTAVSARYVRVTVSQPQGGWAFTDQLMVR
jgi:hypothetical protein